MSYILNPIDKFGAKDTLPEDHPEKKILGVELDEEFIKISASIVRLEQELDPDGDGLYGFVPEAPISTELQGRYNNGVTIEWRPIPNVAEVSWSDVKNKPTSINALGTQNMITGGSY